MARTRRRALEIGAAVSAALFIAGCQTITKERLVEVGTSAACLAATAKQQSLDDDAPLHDVLTAGALRAGACAQTYP